jgi:acetyl-CoA C-acetyltransferase
MEDAVIVSALRAPVGNFGGQFKGVSATELGAHAVNAARERTLLHELRRADGECGLAALCVGGGQGQAAIAHNGARGRLTSMGR